MPGIKSVAGEAAGDGSNGGDDVETAVGDEGENYNEGETMPCVLWIRAVGGLGWLCCC